MSERWVINGRVLSWDDVCRHAAQHRGPVERISRYHWQAGADSNGDRYSVWLIGGNEVQCSCPAARFWRPCKHGARVLTTIYNSVNGGPGADAQALPF